MHIIRSFNEDNGLVNTNYLLRVEQWQGQNFGKGELEIPAFVATPYYQVAQAESHGAFQSNMSILDLLFNMGPESILVLKQSWQ